MKLTLAAIVAFASTIYAQSFTPAATATNKNLAGPPWAKRDPAKWSPIHNSFVSDGKTSPMLTGAPWPTDGYGPGGGRGSGGGGRGFGGPSGPVEHWGGTSSFSFAMHYLGSQARD